MSSLVHPSRRLLLCAAMLALWMAAALPAGAQGGGGYELSWFSMDGGGGTLAAGGYTLSGSVGQPDAGLHSNATYLLVSGYWAGAAVDYKIFVPVLLKP